MKQRQECLDQRRRIIFNNDGNEPVYFCNEVSPEDLLRSRTAPLVGYQVDSIFYCTWSSGFGLFTHHTKIGQVFTSCEAMFQKNLTQEFLDKKIDPLRVMTQFAHQHGTELFWSMRMNDTHDGSSAAYGPVMFRANRLKQEHPEWLIASKDHPLKYGAWSALDYGAPEIRDLAFRFCEEVSQNYEIDGIELDFFRHAFFFKCSGSGAPCGETELKQMTELVTRIRGMTDAVGRNRKRPILLAVRVPDSVEYCKWIGLDLKRWLSEGLIDMLVVGGYTKLNRWDYSVTLGHRYGVKVYPSLDEPRVRDVSARKLRESLETYRGRALNAWEAGADGIYMFNFFDPHSPLWGELGDPAILRTRDRNYFASVRGIGSVPVPHQKFISVPILNPDSPISITNGSIRVEFNMGENLLESKTKAQITLHLQFKHSDSQLPVRLNGKKLSGAKPNNDWVEYPLNSRTLRQGKNELTLEQTSVDNKAVLLLDLFVSVRI